MRVAKEYFSENNRTVGILIPLKEKNQEQGEVGGRKK
jgi:hypothetical protein